MQVIDSLAELPAARAHLPGTLGLVLTMGALHQGHISLIERARAENDSVAATIFVNPTQFNDPKDLASYPRDLDHDMALLRDAGVDLLFLPSPEIMYPTGFQTYVNVETLTQGLEGEHRPGHFQGVATVVAKFFNLFQPTRAYFGQKDAQQVAVIRQMVRDLNFPLEIVTCPILREADGLAMSSRNQRLSPQERQAAPVLYHTLQTIQQAYERGEREPQTLRDLGYQALAAEALARVDYLSVADAETLQELDAPIHQNVLVSLAVFIGSIRLIDNICLPG